jgi:hypothetical protein
VGELDHLPWRKSTHTHDVQTSPVQFLQIDKILTQDQRRARKKLKRGPDSITSFSWTLKRPNKPHKEISKCRETVLKRSKEFISSLARSVFATICDSPYNHCVLSFPSI